MPSKHLSPDLLASIAATDAVDPAHAAGCDACRADLDAMRRLVAGLRVLPDPPARRSPSRCSGSTTPISRSGLAPCSSTPAAQVAPG